MNNQPLLSIVMTGRNDNYGGDFKTRLENCIISLSEQLNRFQISSEIIFVNYNPLPEPAIEDFIAWPKSTEIVQVKVITVPNSLHRDFIEKTGVKNVPVNEYLGKNVGIRRANGEYILCMNPDILFPDQIWNEILSNLDEKTYIRANRLDFELKDGEKRPLTIHLKGHSYSVKKASELEIAQLKIYNLIRNKWKLSTVYFKKVLNLLSIPVYYHRIEFKYHCKTSGDFLMAHRSVWLKNKAYFELANIALHIDALFVAALGIQGLNEKVLSRYMYHQEHERRFSADESIAIEKEAYDLFQEKVSQLVKNKLTTFNTNQWGLEQEVLKENQF